MPQKLTCPHCATTLTTNSIVPAGKSVRCPKCTRTFTVSPMPAAPAAIKGAAGPGPDRAGANDQVIATPTAALRSPQGAAPPIANQVAQITPGPTAADAEAPAGRSRWPQVPPHVLAVSALPLGIAFLALAWRVVIGGSTLVMLLGMLLGLALVPVCFFLVRRQTTFALRPLLLPVGVAAGGFLLVGFMSLIGTLLSGSSTGSGGTLLGPGGAGAPVSEAFVVDLARLQLPNTFGTQRKYDPQSKTWAHSLMDASQRRVAAKSVVEEMPAGAPTNVNAFAEKLKEQDFLAPGWKFDDVKVKEELPDGFVIEGMATATADQPPKSKLALVIYKNSNGAKLRLRSLDVEGPDQVRVLRDVMKNAFLSTDVLLPMPFYPGGFVVTPDLAVLIISNPDEAKLVYIDTLTDKVARQVDVDFKPGALALQGDTLYAAAKGGSQVYALDLKTGKQKKEYATGSDAIAQLACHPQNGLVYATTAAFKVFAIDPAAGTAREAKATGNHVVVDPNGKFVYTAIQPPLDWDEFKVMETADGKLRFIIDRWGTRGKMMKYAVEGDGLKLAATQDNAATNGWALHLTPDGKRIGFMGGGGWRPPADVGGTGGGYFLALFNTDDLKSMAGQAEHGLNACFHPTVNLGVTNHYGSKLTFYNSKSLVKRSELDVVGPAKAEERRPSVLAFVGKGRKLALWNGPDATKEQGLHIIQLKLTDEEKASLGQ